LDFGKGTTGVSTEEANGEKCEEEHEKELGSGLALEAAEEPVAEGETCPDLAAGQGLVEGDREAESWPDSDAGLSSSPGAGQQGVAETDEAAPGDEDVAAGAAASVAGGRLKGILEALIFCSESPLSLERMVSLVDGADRREVKRAVEELVLEYRNRQGGLEIVEVAGGFQVRTRPEFAAWVAKLRQQKPARLSRAALEALAIVAYRQPVTRAEIEAIRGVDCAAAIGSLLEKRLVRIVGRKEVPGRPILYGTTQEFLELFGLKNLKSLPTLREIEGMFAEQKPEDRQPELEGVSEPAGAQSSGQTGESCSGSGDEDQARKEYEKRELSGWPEEAESLLSEESGEEDQDQEDRDAGETLDDVALRKAMDDVLRKSKTRFVRYEEVFQTEGEGEVVDESKRADEKSGSREPS